MRFNVDFAFSSSQERGIGGKREREYGILYLIRVRGERGWGKREREYGILYLIKVKVERKRERGTD